MNELLASKSTITMTTVAAAAAAAATALMPLSFSKSITKMPKLLLGGRLCGRKKHSYSQWQLDDDEQQWTNSADGVTNFKIEFQLKTIEWNCNIHSSARRTKANI